MILWYDSSLIVKKTESNTSSLLPPMAHSQTQSLKHHLSNKPLNSFLFPYEINMSGKSFGPHWLLPRLYVMCSLGLQGTSLLSSFMSWDSNPSWEDLFISPASLLESRAPFVDLFSSLLSRPWRAHPVYSHKCCRLRADDSQISISILELSSELRTHTAAYPTFLL